MGESGTFFSSYKDKPCTVKKIDGIPGLFLIPGIVLNISRDRNLTVNLVISLHSFFPFYGYEMCPSYGQEIFCTVSERLNSLHS